MKTKLKRYHILLSFVSTILIANSCPNQDYQPDSTLTIVNNSSDSLLYYIDFRVSEDTLLTTYNLYPDESTKHINLILPYSEKTDKDAFVKTFEKLNHEILMLFLFKYNVVEQNAWDTIKKHYLVEKRYDLSLDKLQQYNWVISYP